MNLLFTTDSIPELTAIAPFLVQETITTCSYIGYAYKNNFNLIIISSIFLIDTIITFFIGFQIGKFLSKSIDKITSKFSIFIFTRIKKILISSKNYLDRYGKESLLFIIAFSIAPPIVTGALSSFLNVKFSRGIIFVVLGNILWYITILLTVIGAINLNIFGANSILLYIFVGIILVLIFKYVSKKILN